MDKKDKVVPISFHENFMGKVKELNFADLTADNLGAGLWDQEIKAFIEGKTLKGLFFHEDWVFILVDLVSDYISSSPLKVFKVDVIKGKKSFTPDEGHPLNDLYQFPNEFESGQDFMYRYHVEDLLMGNVIQWKPKMIESTMIIPADDVCLNFTDQMKLKNYMVNSPGQGFQGTPLFNSSITLKPDVVWHKRRPNPASMLWGLSPFIPNRKSILFNRYSQDYLNAFYLRGATPGMALKMEKNVSEESALRFLRSFETANTGRRNNRRTLILPKGVDAQILTPTLGDQRLVDVINQNREKILAILRVQKHILSLATQGSLGSEEAKQALRVFYHGAVIPVQMKTAKFLTMKHKEREELADDRVLMFDNSHVAVLTEDLLAKAELGIKLRGQWTVNEIRTELWDKPRVPDGDALTSVIPNDQGNNPIAGQTDAPTEEEEPEQNEAEEESKSLEEWIDPNEKEVRESRAKILRDKYSVWLDETTKQMDSQIVSKGSKIFEMALDLFVSMAERSVRIAKRRLNEVPAKTKADGDEPSKIPSKRQLRKDLRKSFTELESKWASDSSEVLEDSMELGGESMLGLIVDAEARTEVAVLQARNKEDRRRILAVRGIESFKSIRDSRTEEVIRVIEDGVKRGKNIGAIADDIVKKFNEIGRSNARRIAETEVLTAISIGEKAAMDNTAKVIPDLIKGWIHSNDVRVRGRPDGLYPNAKDNHWDLQGDTIPVKDASGRDTEFDNGLRYPRDVRATDPSQVIRCRCRLIMSTPQDIQALNLPQLG